MINTLSLKALQSARWTSHFNRPLYQNYAFSCIPDTIAKLLTGKGKAHLCADVVGGEFRQYDCVIVFLIDGFGWKFFETYASKYPFLNRFNQEGVASKISSQFPSTTAAHVTTLNTGQEVGQTGIYEWFYYEPIVDRMIAPLLFSHAGDHEGGTLLKEGFTPHQIFPFTTIYEQLAQQGVKSIVLQQEGIARSPYSSRLLTGAEVIAFTHFPAALDRLVTLCHTPFQEPTYIFVYCGDIDAVGHRQGIGSPQFADAVDSCWNAMEQHFWHKMGKCPNKTAVICTADHGMTPVDPKTTVLLNKVCPELTGMVKHNQQGMPLVPAGSCRDFFLHIEEEKLTLAQSLLSDRLDQIADVIPVEQLIKEGFFGALPPSERFKQRVGNLVVLPYMEESVFWSFEKHRLEQHFYAAHGGLTPDEMESIFLFSECLPF